MTDAPRFDDRVGEALIATPTIDVGERTRATTARRYARSHHGRDATWLRVTEGGRLVFLACRSGRGWECAP